MARQGRGFLWHFVPAQTLLPEGSAVEVMARACVLWACSRWAPGGFCCVFSLLQDLYNVSVRVSEEQGDFPGAHTEAAVWGKVTGSENWPWGLGICISHIAPGHCPLENARMADINIPTATPVASLATQRLRPPGRQLRPGAVPLQAPMSCWSASSDHRREVGFWVSHSPLLLRASVSSSGEWGQCEC